MKQIYYFLGIFFALAISRFIPHPPNFTSLIALSFYVPVIFGIRYMPVVLVSFVITDLVIGFHSTLFFTWGSVILIGFISKYFTTSILKRLGGALSGACIFFIVTNFGVWITGSYGYNLDGLIASYTLALPFFGYSAISTLIFSVLIETVYKIAKFNFKNI
jgi:hypothetical protein|tara:strand:+ start:83 stop:565 length:483 start_codon:yes stop_codon:yes gene_type:complete